MADKEQIVTTNAALSKNRMEAFSDGVLAIAITLLVLDLALRPPGSALEQFLRGWPSYFVYLVSFLTIGAAWIAHTSLTDDLDHVDRIFLRLNLLFLLSIAFLPFPTRLLGEALDKGTSWQRVAVTVFGLTMLATRLLFAAMAAYARHEGLRPSSSPDRDLQEAQKKFRSSSAFTWERSRSACSSLASPSCSILLRRSSSSCRLEPSPKRWQEAHGTKPKSVGSGNVFTLGL